MEKRRSVCLVMRHLTRAGIAVSECSSTYKGTVVVVKPRALRVVNVVLAEGIACSHDAWLQIQFSLQGSACWQVCMR